MESSSLTDCARCVAALVADIVEGNLHIQSKKEEEERHFRPMTTTRC